MKKTTKITVIFSVLLTTFCLFGQEIPLERMGSVRTQNFDQNWLFARYGLQADGTRISEPEKLEAQNFKDNTWRKLDLPHDWAIEGPFRIELKGETGKLPWKGIGWYRKHFKIEDLDKGQRIFIDFDGAMANAKVYCNGKYAGGWAYGYNSFRVDITDFVNYGEENVLAVQLDTEKWDSRWYPGAGIYRHVWMVKTNPVHVAHWGTYITTRKVDNNRANVKIQVKVDNDSDNKTSGTLITEIYELDSNDKPTRKVGTTTSLPVEVNAKSQSTVVSTIDITNPKRWDLETPNRYVAKTTVTVKKSKDIYYSSFGIRTIEFTARNGFLLNGKRVKIQGTCNHHDLGALGAAMNTSALKRQLLMLQEVGCNSIRTSHNPPAPDLLELADKMGLLVWDEAFDTWNIAKKELDYNKLYDEWHQKDLQAMVWRDQNHPSVFIWSIGNEVKNQDKVDITKHLADIIRKEDPTRPVSNGYNYPDKAREAGAPVGIDLMGVNYFFNRQPEWDLDPRYANQPVIGSETSSTVSSRGEYFFGKDLKKDAYKNWQISSYDNVFPGWGCSPDTQFATNVKLPHLLGEYIWTGWDYLGEPTPYNSDETNLLNFRADPTKRAELEKKLEEIRKNNPPSRSSYFGIIDLAGFKKDRFYLYQSQWKPEEKMAHILPHWNWEERIDSIVPVHVYTSGDEGELFLNGKSLGKRKMDKIKEFRLIWEDVKYVPGELKVVTYKNGKKWAEDVVKTTGKPNKLNLTANQKTISNNGIDLIFVTVKVCDDQNIMVPRSNNEIEFSVEGNGEIVATDNGDATSFVPFQSHKRPAYNGMALVILKAKKGSTGKFVVKAKSPKLREAELIINIQ